MEDFISAIVSAIVGALAGGIAGYYSAKRIVIRTKTMEETDRLREDLLADYDSYMEMAGLLEERIRRWMSRMDNQPKTRRVDDSGLVRVMDDGGSGSVYANPLGDIPWGIREYKVSTDDLTSRFNDLMPTSNAAEPYYYNKMSRALLDLKRETIRINRVETEVQPYLDKLEQESDRGI